VKDPDPACSHDPKLTAAQERAAIADYFRRTQRGIRRLFGVPASKLAVKSVRVKNFTGHSGDAEADYGYPDKVQGNDNWNSFSYTSGYWHLAGCEVKAPIGGQSSDSGQAIPPSTP